MHPAALLLLLVPLQDPSFVERVTFPGAEDVAKAAGKDPVRQRVLKLLLDKEHWKAAQRRVEEKLGPLAADVRVHVKLAEADGAKHAEVGFDPLDPRRATLTLYVAAIAKNERDLEEFHRENERLRKRKEPPLKWINPCLRVETLLPHELVHVWELGSCEEDWLFEGLAAWVAGQEEMVVGCLNQEKVLREIGQPVDNPESVYGRGVLFLDWAEKTGGPGTVRKLAERVFHGAGEAPDVLADLLGKSWEELKRSELAATKADAPRRKK